MSIGHEGRPFIGMSAIRSNKIGCGSSRRFFEKWGQRGQSMLEFLFMALFIMLFIIGFMELIFLLYAYNVVADGAKEGVRYAIVHGTLSTNCMGPSTGCDSTAAKVKSAVTDYANHSGQTVKTSEITVTYSDPKGGAACSNPGCEVQISIAHQYRPLFGLGWPTVMLHAAARGTLTF
jgi:Flp pilus assembly protein TadG